MVDQSLPAMFFDRAAGAPLRAAYRSKAAGFVPGAPPVWVDTTFGEARRRVEQIASGLLGEGLAPGAAVAVLCRTRLEWMLVDWAAMSLGLKVVAVYPSLLADEVGFILQDADVRLVVVEDAAQLAKVRGLRDGFAFQGRAYPGLRPKIVVVDEAELAPDVVDRADGVDALAALERRGRATLDATADARARRLAALGRDDVAGYVYTSGTTGAPKGVVLTHGNWLSLLEATEDVDMFVPEVQTTGALLFLPLAHSFGRFVAWGGAYFRTPILFSSMETLREDLAQTRPGFVPSAPRMYEKMHARIQDAVASANPRRRKLFSWALDVGKQTIPYRREGRPLPAPLRARHAVADRLVLSKIRARLGLDRCTSMLSGSAPLAREVHEFFLAIGVLLVEAYGLTETAPGLTANTPKAWKVGTVGKPLKGVLLKIAPDGEILAKGPNVTRGYHKRDDANAEAFDADGWFRTGDVGEFDDEGFLRLTDRKKDLLKTSGGKYVAPQKIEGLLKTKPLIGEAVVVGDGRRYCTALLVVDDEALREWARRTGEAPDLRGEAVRRVLQQGVDDVNAELSSFETIKSFRVVDDAFSVENGLLTASFKVKRKAVVAKYAPLIEGMYA